VSIPWWLSGTISPDKVGNHHCFVTSINCASSSDMSSMATFVAAHKREIDSNRLVAMLSDVSCELVRSTSLSQILDRIIALRMRVSLRPGTAQTS
jgi:hypothetical protein